MSSSRPDINQVLPTYRLPNLHPDLQPYQFEDELHHPLLNYECGVYPRVYGRINTIYQYRKTKAASKLEPNLWQSYYPHLDVTERLHKFIIEEMAKPDFPKRDPDFFKLLSQIWTDKDTEAWGQSSGFLELLLGIADGMPLSKHARHMMTSTEQDKLAALPDELTVFRGHAHPLLQGISWTLKLDVALLFAVGNPLQSSVSIGTVQKSDVIALIDRWDEDELIVLTRDVYEVETHPIDDRWCPIERTAPWQKS
ncbi:hypothetical protein HRE53_08145 [Acaryochloris sp. 'Moss Beach']|uniref:hypothetical protein n=1 Tax=Acaryochloris sp. 'Moss Beach' TaxID=2740837 RepID=UPI001F37190F|nr:hypothetical protein [Acaryochloris sp. 'Moss Beach']UJB70988.1 hypothetical protein HRE53_08145 [Acaryochloris sp. 'Moss Beach']